MGKCLSKPTPERSSVYNLLHNPHNPSTTEVQPDIVQGRQQCNGHRKPSSEQHSPVLSPDISQSGGVRAENAESAASQTSADGTSKPETTQAFGPLSPATDSEMMTILRLLKSVVCCPYVVVLVFKQSMLYVLIPDGEGVVSVGAGEDGWLGWDYGAKSEKVTAVTDVTQDPTFAQSKLTSNFPDIKLYCGAPLLSSSGESLGCLCFGDTVSREVPMTQTLILSNLADMVIQHLNKLQALEDSARGNEELNRAFAQLHQAMDCADRCVVLLDISVAGWKILYANLAWDKMTGCDRLAMKDKLVSDVMEMTTVSGTFSTLPTEAHKATAQEGKEFSIEGASIKQAILTSAPAPQDPHNIEGGPRHQKLLQMSGTPISGKLHNSGNKPFGSGTTGGGRTGRASLSLQKFVLRLSPAESGQFGLESPHILGEACFEMDKPGFEAPVIADSRLYCMHVETIERARKVQLISHSVENSASVLVSGSIHGQQALVEGLDLGKLLGKGSFGSVYSGTWFGVAVAVKVIEQEAKTMKAIGSSMEALLGSELRHPNIISTLKYQVQTPSPQVPSSSASHAGPSSTSTSAFGGYLSSDKEKEKEKEREKQRGKEKEKSVEMELVQEEDESKESGTLGMRPLGGRSNDAIPLQGSKWSPATLCHPSRMQMQSDPNNPKNRRLRKHGSSGLGNYSKPLPRQSGNDPGAFRGARSAGAASSRARVSKQVTVEESCDVTPSGPSEVAEEDVESSDGSWGDGSPLMSRKQEGPAIGLQLIQTIIVMEYADRGSLHDAIDKGWLTEQSSSGRCKPSMPAILATSLEIAAALNYLHSHGVVHGDLSAYNVLLTSQAGTTGDPRGFVAKVADFGLSRTLEAATEIQTLTYGTITHQPPETLAEGIVSRETDTYSLGVLMWQMYTRLRPWAGMGHGQIMMAVTGRTKTLTFPEECMPEFADLAMSCMAFKADDRPGMAEMCTLLRTLKKTAGPRQSRI